MRNAFTRFGAGPTAGGRLFQVFSSLPSSRRLQWRKYVEKRVVARGGVWKRGLNYHNRRLAFSIKNVIFNWRRSKTSVTFSPHFFLNKMIFVWSKLANLNFLRFLTERPQSVELSKTYPRPLPLSSRDRSGNIACTFLTVTPRLAVRDAGSLQTVAVQTVCKPFWTKTGLNSLAKIQSKFETVQNFQTVVWTAVCFF